MRPQPPNRSMILLVLAVVIASIGGVLVVAGALGTLAPPGPVSVASESASTPPVASVVVTPGPTEPATPAPSATPTDSPIYPVLVGAGDIARCDGTDDEAVAALLERTPGIVFTLGDNAYDAGSEQQFRDCYAPGWGRVLVRTRFAVAGNHDYATDDAAPFRAYFGDAAVRNDVTWFSEDVGSWHVVVLDANCGELDGGCGPGSPQLRWLRDDLAASHAGCTLAMWHQPRFSSGIHGNDEAVAPFWDALYAAGADLVLNGHDHDYERFRPQSPAGEVDRTSGITEIVVGTGGGGLRDFGRLAPNAVVRSNVAFGVLELTLQPAGWGFRFLSTDGSFSDQGSRRCH